MTRKRRHLVWCRLFLCLLAEDVCEVGLSRGCDEKLWPHLTGLVDAFGEDEDSSVDGVLHGDDLALPVAECEFVVEEPPAELVGSHVLASLRQDLAEGAGCEVSFCCFDGTSEGCDRPLCFDFCFGFVASWMMMSGLAIISSMVAGVAYMPCLRMEGRTSLVTQRRNALASGLSDRMMTS